jgi:hypothetical protein
LQCAHLKQRCCSYFHHSFVLSGSSSLSFQLGKVSLASPRLALTDISEEETARQLTLIEHSLICKLKVRRMAHVISLSLSAR